MRAPKVLIVHPFMPAYRVALVSELGARVEILGGKLLFAESTPPPAIALRQDSRTTAFGVQVPTKWMAAGGHDIAYRSVRSLLPTFQPELIVVQQEIRNLETYPLFLQARKVKAEIGMWGHGRSYSTPQSAPLAEAKQWLTRRTKWFFAYTQAGADHVVTGGFPRVRTTVLNNTIDTDSLRRDLDSVTADEVASFRERTESAAGKTALFIGGVDEAKGIGFLLDSLPHVASLLPGFTLLIAGDGAQRSLVQAAETAGLPLRYLGRLDGHEKAVALAAADVLAIPEWIGLVAIDSLVAGLPIVSTVHPSHSPEHEYLEDGVTCIYSPHEPGEYAKALVELLSDPRRLHAMQEACEAESKKYSIDLMADRFIEGLLAWDEMRRFGL